MPGRVGAVAVPVAVHRLVGRRAEVEDVQRATAAVLVRLEPLPCATDVAHEAGRVHAVAVPVAAHRRVGGRPEGDA